jgi:hypothetical protein
MKGYTKYIVITIVFFAAISAVFQIAVVDNPDFNIFDLCVNLLSEIAGMIFTVLIFNEFLVYRQRIANHSKNKQLLLELDEFVNELDFTFRAASKKCYDQEYEDDIWNRDYFELIREKIIITEVDDATFPAVPWYLFFSMQGEKLANKCENIRRQYQDILSGSVSDFFFYLVSDSEVLNDLSNIRKILETDIRTKYNRPINLGSYFACPTEKDFAEINAFLEWLTDAIRKTVRSDRLSAQFGGAVPIVCSVLFTAVAFVNYFVYPNYHQAVIFGLAALLFAIGALVRKDNKK